MVLLGSCFSMGQRLCVCVYIYEANRLSSVVSLRACDDIFRTFHHLSYNVKNIFSHNFSLLESFISHPVCFSDTSHQLTIHIYPFIVKNICPSERRVYKRHRSLHHNKRRSHYIAADKDYL